MYYSIYAHRPRTQRIGEDSVARDVFICEFDNERETLALKAKLQKARKAMAQASHPWPGGKMALPNGSIFQISPYDSFYIRCDARKSPNIYSPPKQDTAEELVGLALRNMKSGGL